MSSFSITPKTRITRLRNRGVYDKKDIYAILDEALVCTVSFTVEGQPVQLPTGFCRIDDMLYIHGSTKSHYLRVLEKDELPVCINVTLLDGIVLARTAFNHSMNYRSVIIFSKTEKVIDFDKTRLVMEIFTEKMCPGRWKDIIKPSESEWKATSLLAFSINEVSAKVRTGPSSDSKNDDDDSIWTGVLPIKTEIKKAVPDPNLNEGIALPDYLLSK